NKGSNIANHAWMNDHQIDFKNARVIDKGDYHVRKTLESWHTAMTTEADNNDRSLPPQYSILLKKFSFIIKFSLFFLSPFYTFLSCNFFTHIYPITHVQYTRPDTSGPDTSGQN
ncbi:hypothetical protein ACROYT_G025462, partial [Oculina patagonica]